MASPYFKELDTIVSEMVTDLQNQNPNIEISPGSLVFIKTVAFASAIWGLYKYQDWTLNQIFPDTADTENLEHHASLMGISRADGETDSQLLDRVLNKLRNPPAGGNRYDVERWAKDIEEPFLNVVLNATTVASVGGSGYSGPQVPMALIDADVKSVAFDTNGATAGADITVVLNIAEKMDGVALYLSTDSHPGRWKVEVSENGTDWEEITANYYVNLKDWNRLAFPSQKTVKAVRFILQAAHLTTSATINQVGFYTASEADEVATQVRVFDNTPQPGEFELVAYKVVNDLKTQLSVPTLRSIFDAVDELKPVGTYNFKVLMLKMKETAVNIEVGGAAADLDAIRIGITSLLSNMEPGQTLHRESLIAVAVQNGATTANVVAPAAAVTVGYYESIVAGQIQVLRV